MRSMSTRRMSGKEKSNLILDIQLTHDLAEQQRKKYLSEKEEYNNSEKGLREAEIRGMVQKASGAEREAEKVLEDARKALQLNVIESIRTLIVTKGGKLTLEEMHQLMKIYLLALDKLQVMSENAPLRGSSKYNNYENLFIELIDKVDARFLIFAPEKVLLRKNLPMNKLEEADLVDLTKHVKDLNLDKNKAFVNAYSKYFRDEKEVEDNSFEV